MKKVLKYIKYLLLVVISLIAILIIVANLAEDKITQVALKHISKAINAPVVVNDISFTLIKEFPLATVEFDGFILGAPNYNAEDPKAVGDTLIRLNKLYVSVETMPLLDDIYNVTKVEVEGAKIHYTVDSLGVSCYDFLMQTDTLAVEEEPDTSATTLNLLVEELALDDIKLFYSDKALQAGAWISISKFRMDGEIHGDTIQGNVVGDIRMTHCDYPEFNLHLMKETSVHYDVNLNQNLISINDVNIITDGAQLGINGKLELGDTLKTDLQIEGKQFNVAELVKYSPKGMLEDLGIKETKGMLDFTTQVKGAYADSTLLPRVDFSFSFNDGKVATVDYPQVKNIRISGSATNGQQQNNLTTGVVINECHLETASSMVDVACSIQNLDRINYNVKSNAKINLAEFKDFIPDTLVQKIGGSIEALFSTNGVMPDSINDDFINYVLNRTNVSLTLKGIDAQMDSIVTFKNLRGSLIYQPNTFIVRNFGIDVPDYHVKLKNSSLHAQFKGSLLDYENLGINLHSMRFETGNSFIRGAGSVEKLLKPSFKLNTNLSIDLSDFAAYIPDSLVNKLDGKIDFTCKTHGKLDLDSITDAQINAIVYENGEYALDVKDLNVEMFEFPDFPLKGVQAHVDMAKDTININGVKGAVSELDFAMDTTQVRNIYEAFIKNQNKTIEVETNINLGDIKMAMFAPFLNGTTDNEGNKTQEASTTDIQDVTKTEPAKYTFAARGKFAAKSFLLDYKAGDFVMDSVLFEDISTLFLAKDSTYKLDNLKFNAFNGEMLTSLRYDILKNGMVIASMKNNIHKMDISKLLKDFNNFSQNEITNEQLSGLFSCKDVHSRYVIKDNELILNKITLTGSFTLEDGGVYNYKRATDMSSISGIKELNNIRFHTIQSSLFIYNNGIYFPKTELLSNAVDITAFGMQTFDDKYRYHMGINLREALLGKSKKKNKKQEEGDVKKNKKGEIKGQQFFVMKNTEGKEHFGPDKFEDREEMTGIISDNKDFLKLHFNPLLVNFDTGVEE